MRSNRFDHGAVALAATGATAVALLLTACGSGGENLSQAEGPSLASASAADQVASTGAAADASSPGAEGRTQPCFVDGRIVCSMPRLRARARHDGWIAKYHQWRRNGIGIPGANRAWYVPDPSDPAEAGAIHTVEITDRMGRTLGKSGVLAEAGAEIRLSRR